MRLGTVFSGFGGVDLGAQMAGVDPIWGIELQERIAKVHEDNFPDSTMYNQDFLDVDPHGLEEVDWIHFSPPCVNYSPLKDKRYIDHDIDMDLATQIVHYIKVMNPPHITIENVIQYQNTPSSVLIVNTLKSLGYNYQEVVLNSADYGVPQKRLRYFIIASRIKKVGVPFQSHAEGFNLFGLPKWIGWDEVIDTNEELVQHKPDWLDHWLPDVLPDYALMACPYTSEKSAVKGKGIKLPGLGIPTPTATSHSHNKWFIIKDGLCYLPSTEMWRAWQSFPESYQFPDSTSFSVYGLGNSVPPLVIKAIAEQLQ